MAVRRSTSEVRRSTDLWRALELTRNPAEQSLLRRQLAVELC
jgi:hypothetical protein